MSDETNSPPFSDEGAIVNTPSAEVAAKAKAELEKFVLPAVGFQEVAARFIQLAGEQGYSYVHWQGQYYLYRGSHYEEISTEVMENGVLQFLNICKVRKKVEAEDTDKEKFGPWAPNNTKLANVMKQLRAAVSIPGSTQLPGWINGPDGSDFIALRNGIYRLSDGAIGGHSPAFFNTGFSEFDFNPYAPEPTRWLQFTHEAFPDDPQSIDCLQEIMGYLLTSNTSLHKIFCFIGERRSGKGTIVRVLKALCGKTNMAASTITALASRFGLESAVGKKNLVIGDANMHAKFDSAAAAEIIKNVSGEDEVLVDRKLKIALSMAMKLHILILSNEIPAFVDASGVIASRMILLRFRESFLGREDPNLDAKLAAELPGIFNWCIEGYRRLIARGRFVLPDSSKEDIEDITEASDDVLAFSMEYCRLDPNSEIVREVLYVEYVAFCTRTNRRAKNMAWFGRNLKACHPKITSTRPLVEMPDGSKKQRRAYKGIALL